MGREHEGCVVSGAAPCGRASRRALDAPDSHRGFIRCTPARTRGAGTKDLPRRMDALIAIAAGWLTLAAVLTASVARTLRMREDR